MENTELQTGETQATEVVDYNQLALEKTNDLIGKVDFSIFMTMFVAVIGATIGVSVGITALRKGVAWVKSAIKRAGN